MLLQRSSSLSSTVLFGLILTGCGGSKSGQGTPVGPVLPSVVPTPKPSATPDAPLSASCARLPDGATKYTCRVDPPRFQSDVDDAILTLQHEQPRIFDPHDSHSVTNVGAYYVGLIKILDRQNICAGFDGEELAVKTSSAFNEQYKVLTARSLVNRKYIGDCSPAVFPIPRGPLPPSPAGCDLPPSREVACGDPPSQYEDAMQSAIRQVLKEHPELFDYGDTSPRTGFPRVKDFKAYYADVVEVLSSQGFCGRFDGEEMVIKRTNDFTEHYKINVSDHWLRMGEGIYRGACYPAAF